MKLHLQHQTLCIQPAMPSSVDDLLIHLQIARKQRYLLYQHQLMRTNTQRICQNIPLNAQDTLYIRLPEMEDDGFSASPYLPEVIYEDSLFLVVNKPVQRIVHPDGVNTTDTLCNDVKTYYLLQGLTCPVRPIHRLDRDTTGLVVFCKIPLLQPLLDQTLEQKQLRREYDALVQGIFSPQFITINQPIGKDRHDAHKMRISPSGKPAITRFQLVQTYQDYSLIHCILETGRTHQIRVHCASMHHPILSDPLYGFIDKRISYLALHASKLTFTHPFTKESLTITCPLPDDMKRLL